jgi:hypothetical protein
MFKVAAVRVTKVAAGDGTPSPAPTTTASAPVVDLPGAATAGGSAAEAVETVEAGT